MVYDDVEAVVEIFDRVVSGHMQYISHGELQLGVAASLHELHTDKKAIWRQDVQEYVMSSPNALFVAVSDNTIIGFVIAYVRTNASTTFGTVDDLCVLPEYRHQGVGQRLFETVIEQLKADGAQRVFFESGLQNTEMHTWSKGFGFEPVSMVFVADINNITFPRRS
jgi:ribosomal protein S18 acetylase RimI-like enzyme